MSYIDANGHIINVGDHVLPTHHGFEHYGAGIVTGFKSSDVLVTHPDHANYPAALEGVHWPPGWIEVVVEPTSLSPSVAQVAEALRDEGFDNAADFVLSRFTP